MSVQPEIEWCWLFYHPVGKWCGGTPDDEWNTNKHIVERNASFCEWPTKVISREKPAKQKQAMPGSVRPSIRGAS